MRYAYPCELERDDEGGWNVRFPDIPKARTCGWSREEALAMGADLLHCLFAWSLQDDEEIAPPSAPGHGQELVAVPSETAAKFALNRAMRAQGMSLADLASKVGVSKRAVRRIMDIEHHSRMDQVEEALAAVGLTLVAEVTVHSEAPAFTS